MVYLPIHACLIFTADVSKLNTSPMDPILFVRYEKLP